MSVRDITWVELVLGELEEIKENLLTIYEDIHQDGDLYDPAARRETLAVLAEFNEKFEPLERALDEMMEFIERVTHVQRPSKPEVSVAPDITPPTHVVRALDPQQPHPITEDFRWKRPYGFKLSGQTFQASTWNRLYTLVCERLAELDPKRFEALPDSPEFSDSSVREGFSRSKARFKTALALPHGLYCEGALSARNISNNIRHLLAYFGVPESEMVVYLRSEREEG